MNVMNQRQKLNTLPEILMLSSNHEIKEDQINQIKSILSADVIVKQIKQNPRLSEREFLCLYWSARGKTSQETASLLNITESTVNSYKKSILRKLNCNNIAQCVFEGIKMKTIAQARRRNGISDKADRK